MASLLPLHPPSPYSTCISSPNPPYLSSPHDRTTWTCFSSEHYQLPLCPSYPLTPHYFLPSQRGPTHPPNHWNLCPIQHRSMPLLHWPCLTSIQHATWDRAPIDLTFQFEQRSFESQVWDNSQNFFQADLTLETTAESAPPSAFSSSNKSFPHFPEYHHSFALCTQHPAGWRAPGPFPTNTVAAVCRLSFILLHHLCTHLLQPHTPQGLSAKLLNSAKAFTHQSLL